jgi:hypothetical protein
MATKRRNFIHTLTILKHNFTVPGLLNRVTTDRHNATPKKSEIAIVLTTGENAAYTVFGTEQFQATVTIKAKANTANSVFKFTFNDLTTEIQATDTTWNEFVFDNAQVKTGKNTLKAEVTAGNISFLHFDVKRK